MNEQTALLIPEELAHRKYINSYGDVVNASWYLEHKDKIPATWFYRFIIKNWMDDTRHRTPGQISATMMTGCPRRDALNRLAASPIYPDRMTSPSVGTAMHEYLADTPVPDVITEEKSPTVFSAEFQGVKLTGQIDGWIEQDGNKLNLIAPFDYKIRNPQAKRFHHERKDYPQVSIYAWLAEQNGFEIDFARVYTCYFYNWDIQDYVKGQPDGIVPIDQLMSHASPYCHPYTLQQITDHAVKASQCTTVDEVLDTIPPIGEVGFGGNMCKLYCPFDAVCHPERLNI